MNDNLYLTKTICEKLADNHYLILATIISLQGSSPRHGGTKMVVDQHSKSYGTIGGSLLEATVIKEAGDALSKRKSRLLSYDLTGENAYSKDMICGGSTRILLDFISATKENLEFFKAMHDAIAQGRNIFFLTMFKGQDQDVEVLGHTLYTLDGNTVGNYPWKEADLDMLKSEAKGLTATTILASGDGSLIIDPIRKVETLFCFGAGHVALSTAHIAALAGFRVVVIDDRAEYANTERFPDADEIHVIKDFNNAMDGLSIDADSYIVIFTHGHAYDRVVLQQALQTNACYVGMISSKRKREMIYKALMEQGVSNDALTFVHSPIGLNIGGETPAEIAVSIVGELISERYKKKS
ncbi:MAG TPA: XdhC family protein [Smithella sp.]|nr:XdhC family protein [Smithella sp.]